jgi:transcriptional regulator with XRE-family HTH domain
MHQNRKTRSELAGLGTRLAAARTARGLTQADLARRCHLHQQQIAFWEQGLRLPRLDQILRLAAALDAPLQLFLSGTNRPPSGLRSTAIELRSLGLVDLWVEAPLVPGAFRPPEQLLALTLRPEEPEARVVEGIPAVLAWNRWNTTLLRAFGVGRIGWRLGWLAEVALTLHRMAGFPGGCPGRDDLARLVSRLKTPPTDHWDSLGKPGAKPPRSPVWKRWRISYAADLSAFRERAEAILALRKVEHPGSFPPEGDS